MVANAFFVLLGQIVVGSLVAAIVFRAAMKWIEKREVPFGQAYMTMLLSGLATGILGFFLGLLVALGTGSHDAVQAAGVLMLPGGFLLQSELISLRHRLSFGRACLVSLGMAAIGILILLVLVLPALLVLSLAG